MKPENVLVRFDDVAKILDFGIAQQRNRGSNPSFSDLHDEITLDPEELADLFEPLEGTPRYMAPEHLRGDALDGRADQFAWAVVAYELLTGKHPWRAGAAALAVAAEIISRDPHPLRSVEPRVPEAIADAIMRALEKQSGDRFPTMHALLEVLEVAPSEGVTLEPVTRTAPTDARLMDATQARRRRAPVTRPSGFWPGLQIVTAGAVAALVARGVTPAVATGSERIDVESGASTALELTSAPARRCPSAFDATAVRAGLAGFWRVPMDRLDDDTLLDGLVDAPVWEELRNEFGVQLPPREPTEVRTVGDLARIIVEVRARARESSTCSETSALSRPRPDE